ncbi:MAG: carbohydrate porin [Taibaiella sp.]|nr:carbohydrate porin [Taibaiella sp.]
MKVFFTGVSILIATVSVFAQDSMQRFNLHFQTTYIYQYKPAFHSPYQGSNSLRKGEEKQNSVTATLFFGARLWKGGEIYINPEVAGGSGLSGAFGLAASTNGETFRVGDPAPTLYLARGFFRQTIALDHNGETVRTEDIANQLQSRLPKDYFQFYIGKFGLSDLMDNNLYANSPRTQFLNWCLMNTGAWDYAANTRGYTYAAAAVLQKGKMSYVLSLAAMPVIANGQDLNTNLNEEYALNASIARVISMNGRAGNIRLLGFVNKAHMGNYREALQNSDPNNVPDIIADRKFGRYKTGFAISADQSVTENVGIFLRLGYNDGKNETWTFTEADRSSCAGLNIGGAAWKRKNDNLGIGLLANGLSKDHKGYLSAGGLGFQLGDSTLTYSNEMGTEIYYSYKPIGDRGIWFTGDYQLIINPGYNKDRGPVNVFSLRVHVEL